MAEDKELVLPAGLDDMGVDPLDKLRLSPPVPPPSDIIPLSMIIIRSMIIILSMIIIISMTIILYAIYTLTIQSKSTVKILFVSIYVHLLAE